MTPEQEKQAEEIAAQIGELISRYYRLQCLKIAAINFNKTSQQIIKDANEMYDFVVKGAAHA